MNIWILVGLVLTRGVVISFSRPTRMTVIYALVGRELLPSALAMNSMIFNASRFLGPALGGTIIATLSTGWSFVVSFFLFWVMTFALRAIDEARIAMPPPTIATRSIWAETVEGFNYILHHEGIRTQLTLLIVVSIFAKPVTDLLPGFAADVFGRGSSGLAWLLSAHGAGAMVGAFWMTMRGGITGLTRVTLINILVMALALLLFVATDNFWVALPMAAVVGFAFIAQSVSNQTLIQSAIETGLRGRVLSVYGMINQAVPSLGTMAIGLAAERWGLRAPVAIGAIVCLALWLWTWRFRGHMATLLETAPREAAAD
jgi:predicted MFS family arabinose efflux permease